MITSIVSTLLCIIGCCCCKFYCENKKERVENAVMRTEEIDSSSSDVDGIRRTYSSTFTDNYTTIENNQA